MTNAEPKKRILIVDDEKDLCETLMDIVSLVGYESIGAKDGLVALDILKTETFDFIISDIQMPECTGTQLLKACMDLGLTTPFIFLSGDDSYVSEISSLRSKGVSFLAKPIDFDALIRLLARGA